MAPHRKIEISNATLSEFLRLISAKDAAEMIKECFSLEDMRIAVRHIFDRKNLPTNIKLERFMNRKARLEIKEDN